MKSPGDPRHDRVLANQWIVRCVARRFRVPVDIEFEDLCQMGNLGLMRAAARFDPDPDRDDQKSFGRYARPAVKNAIFEGVDRGARMVSVSERSRLMLRKFRRVEARLAATGARPTRSEVYDAMGLTRPRRAWMDRIFVVTDASCASAGDASEGYLAALAPEACDGEERAEFVRWAMGHLDERSRRFLAMRFGLDGSAPMGYRDMADREGCCVRTAWFVTSRAVEVLRALLERMEIVA